MSQRLRLREVLVVEGKYDASALQTQVDALILTTDGFSIFSNEEQKELLRRLGRQRGLIILTDSDAAGFRIRHYVEKIAAGCDIKHAYIPAVQGKERRKQAPSKEGTLGVEGMPPQLLREALEAAGVQASGPRQGREISYTDLYELGLSGGQDSARRRRDLLARVGLPHRLSKKALRQVLASLYSYEELIRLMEEKPVLFWDFHGTLSLPDITWFEAAMEAAAEQAPEHPMNRELLVQHFSRACLPWWTVEGGDTRHITGSKAWWAYCEGQFASMFQRCGFSEAQAKRIAPQLRAKMLQPERYALYPDALPTLRTLQKRGYRSFILSNNYPELEHITDALGLRPYIQQVLTSGQVGYEKPRREIFTTALEAAGNPAAAWMLGDNPQDDIEGAAAAGWTTVLLHGKDSAHADHALEHLADVLPLLP